MGLLTNLVLLTLGVCLAAASNLTDSEILEFEAPAEMKESLPYYLSGYDNDGAPIWVFELGKWDMRQFVEKGGEVYDALDIYLDQMFLNMRESGLNTSAKQFIAIGDLDEFSLRQAAHIETVQFIVSRFVRFKEILRGGQMKHGWVINANDLWRAIWKVGSPLMGVLSSSIDVYGTDKDMWIPKLLEQLPNDQIVESYGGLPNHKPVKILG